MQVGKFLPDMHTRHRVTYTRRCIDTIDSPNDEHEVARNMKRIEINIKEKRIVRQVGHLPELLTSVIAGILFYFIVYYFDIILFGKELNTYIQNLYSLH
jgi:hypothetical protein